jgi:hypothetical protein
MKSDGEVFGRFNAMWTPVVLILDPSGVERHRIEGYLPRDEFRAALELGLGRVAFTANRFDEAVQWYSGIVERDAGSAAAAEAMYWRAVSRYKSTGNPSSLGEVAEALQTSHPDSEWTRKSSIWLPEQPMARAA